MEKVLSLGVYVCMVYATLLVNALRGENLCINIILTYFPYCQEIFMDSAIFFPFGIVCDKEKGTICWFYDPKPFSPHFRGKIQLFCHGQHSTFKCNRVQFGES